MKIQTERVVCRFSVEELALIDQRRGTLARATYVRKAALKHLPPQIPAINREAWTELARVGANLNQLSKVHNQGGELDPVELNRVLADVRAALLGVQFGGEDEGDE